VRRPTPDEPLRVVDLGCGNGYLTFAAHRYLSAVLGLPVHTTGVDVKAQSREHNTAVAERLELGDQTDFVEAGIDGWTPTRRPDVVLALHACDTATDDALAQAVEWGAPLVLAAPCCHHDLSAQLREITPPPGLGALLRDGILRERFADTLTDAVRALLLRTRGYRVDVVEFVDSAHTPRNTLLRAVRTGADGRDAQAELDAVLEQWPVRPALVERLR
jgi:SAM-dependent methyltransferase